MPNKQPRQSLWKFMFGSRSKEEESAFRHHYLDDDIRQVTAITYAATGMLMALTLVDIPNIAENPALLGSIATRTVLMAIGFGSVWAMKKYRRIFIVDMSVILFTGLVAIGIIAVHHGAGSSGVRIVGTAIFAIMTLHIAYPSYPLTLFPIAVIIIVGEIFIIFSAARSDLTPFRTIIPVLLIFAEYTSVVASAHYHRTRYNAFHAISKVKALSGMLPICANCKNIRDDKGYYQQIERYITEHSEAEFTHGICPDCAKELYPGIKYHGIETKGS